MAKKKESKVKDVKEAAYSAGGVYPALRACVGDPGDECADGSIDYSDFPFDPRDEYPFEADPLFDDDLFAPGSGDRVARFEEILDSVSAILSEREGDYGDPMVSMMRIGRFWGGLFGVDYDLSPSEVALAMAAFKINRERCKHSTDNIVDACAYIVLAGVLAEEEGR